MATRKPHARAAAEVIGVVRKVSFALVVCAAAGVLQKSSMCAAEGGPGGVLHRSPEFHIKFQNFRKWTRKILIRRQKVRMGSV